MKTLLQAPTRTLLQAPVRSTRIAEKPVYVSEETAVVVPPTPASPEALSPETDEERRAKALATVSDDPAIQGFYERVVPRGITPSAWLPFWPSAWPGLRDYQAVEK
jgi:hypothetical protein